jgi:hypothetical protein
MTPSQVALLHLKSGALGFFFDARLSHIAPPHFGQAGVSVVEPEPWYWCMRVRTGVK